MLTKDQKKSRLDISKYFLSPYEDDLEEFMCQVVTQDETWVLHFDPEAKKGMQWKHPGSPPTKKFNPCPAELGYTLFCKQCRSRSVGF